jgi:hypothetical protein
VTDGTITGQGIRDQGIRDQTGLVLWKNGGNPGRSGDMIPIPAQSVA